MQSKRRHLRLTRIGVVVASVAAAVACANWYRSPWHEATFISMPSATFMPGSASLHSAAGFRMLPESGFAVAAQAKAVQWPLSASSALVTWGIVAACCGVLRRYSRSRPGGRSSFTKRWAALPEKVSGQSNGRFPHRPTPILDTLGDEGPQKLRGMSIPELVELAEEVRWQVLDAVSVTGGHLGSALGVVELTVALHHVFDTPRDQIIWDVGHQVYPHKVLTGRRGQIYTLRQGGGLSGFSKRSESEYDAFGAGHSSTSISAALGFQVAHDLTQKRTHSIAVIGDGAITGGMAWEAMNHAGGLKAKMIVILNDNSQVSLPTAYNSVDQPVGALARTLGSQETISHTGLDVQGSIARIETSQAFQSWRQRVKDLSKKALPSPLSSAAAKVDEYIRDLLKTAPFQGSGSGAKGELFEQLGFYYVGPIDGHDMDTLVAVLENLKRNHDEGQIDKPILLHIKTHKGKGYAPAETARDKLHAVTPKFNVEKPASAPTAEADADVTTPMPTLTTVFGQSLVKEAECDEKIVAITAAMPGGTGVSIFEKRFGSARTFDVAIAEQHAVAFAGALAAGGLKPFCCIYSSFFQRGYDQVVHDVALQNLPVRFVLDRSGLVGGDGPTHNGSFDLSYLACIPNLKICAPADEAELVHMTHTLAKLDDGPSVMRYPRGACTGEVEMPAQAEYLEPGKGRIVREGHDGSLAILSLGSRLRESLEAARRLEGWGIHATVADARWVKPLDEALVKRLATQNRVLITVEENSIGGFSSQVSHLLQEHGSFDGMGRKPLVLRSMVLPDRFIAADDDPKKQYDDAELNAPHIMAKALAALNCAGVRVDALSNTRETHSPLIS